MLGWPLVVQLLFLLLCVTLTHSPLSHPNKAHDPLRWTLVGICMLVHHGLPSWGELCLPGKGAVT